MNRDTFPPDQGYLEPLPEPEPEPWALPENLVKDPHAPLFSSESDERNRIRKRTGQDHVDFLAYDAVYQQIRHLPRSAARQNLLRLYVKQERAKRELIQAARVMEGEVSVFAEEVLQQGTEAYAAVKPMLEDFKSVELRVFFRN